MNLKVVREPSKNDYTLGKLYIDGVFECHTIEDVIRPQGVKVQGKTAIPPGRYKLILSMSNRFQKLLPEVLNVPGFTGVRIHSGNTSLDTEGCLIVGISRAEGRVNESRKAMEALMTKLQASPSVEKWIEYQNPVVSPPTQPKA